jgi:hypothetical protein
VPCPPGAEALESTSDRIDNMMLTRIAGQNKVIEDADIKVEKTHS